MNDAEKITLLMGIREACFTLVDVVEKILHINPTTADLRKSQKNFEKQLHRQKESV